METVAEIAEFLARTTLFSNLPPAARTGLATVMRRRDLQKGDVLFDAGAPGNAAFVVRSGLIQIVDRGTGQLLNEITRGGQLGEMAVLSGEPRAARAVAAVDSVLYEIDAPTLRELFERQPDLHARLSLELIRMLQKRVRRPGGARLAGFMAPPDRGPECREIACAVARELKTAANESVVVLDAYAGPVSDRGAARGVGEDVGDMTQFVRGLLGPETIVDESGIPVLRLASGGEEGRIGGLFAELRSRFDRVIVVAAHPFGPGACSALAQCERLYTLGPQGPAVVGSRWVAEVENELRGEIASPPVLQPLRVEQASGRELRSLAREIGGRRRALVLGAGGAKGMAHIGALAAFERAGIEFDEIGGSSAGAVVGALHASGWTATDAGAMLIEVAANPWKTLLDVGVPTESVFLSRKKTELFERYAGGRRIEDLPIPFFAVAGDLRSLAPVVFRSGPIAVALDATTAVPAIFRPVELGDALLVDGWVCNPLPADVARQAGHEQVVAIDLSSPDPSLPKGQGLGAPSPEGRFQMLAIALRAMELGSQEHVMRNLPLIDILVRPDVSEFTASDFAAASVMRDRGEAAGEAAVAAIRGFAAARRP